MYMYVCVCVCRLGDMKVSECKFYDSKMRPLLLVYDNPDVLSVLPDVRIMFKHGDGRCLYDAYLNGARSVNLVES